MSDPRLACAVERLRALPEGTRKGRTQTRRYIASTSRFSAGRSLKLVAIELGGPDYISANLYHLRSGPRLCPCEMSRDKVIDFILAFRPDQELA